MITHSNLIQSFLLSKRARLYPVIAIFLTASVHCSAQAANNASDKSASEGGQPTVTLPSLPNPLDLETVLASFAHSSPEIAMQQANIDLAKASLEGNQVDNSWQANIEGRLGRREFDEENQPHNLLALHVGKVLYDFDRTETQRQADQTLLEQQTDLLKMFENKQRLNAIKAYLNVLLADFQFRIDDEGMAIEYVGYDKVQDRHALGQLSDVDLLEAEQSYQNALVKRMQAEQMQLQTRIELANVLGLPNARPDELRFPELKSFNSRSVKSLDLQKLQNQVMQTNPQLVALKQAQQAQLFMAENAQKTSAPSVRADAWVGSLSSYPELREGSWKATISLDVPLYDGGAKSSAIAKAQADLNKLKAQSQQIEQSLRTQVNEIYFQLKLLDAEKRQHQVFGDYADLYLDYSRALYENESATDLGDAMVRLSEANYRMVAWRFKQALLWLQLDYLLGKPISLSSSENVTAEQAQPKE